MTGIKDRSRMPPPRARFGIFYGWWIVAAGSICLLLAGGIGYYTFGAFFIPLVDEFGWTRAQLSLAATIASVLGLAAPLIGTWVDKYGARVVMAVGALITGVAFALLGLTQSLWYFYLMYLIVASGHFGILNIPVTKVVSNWFVERRGLAIGITLTGFGIGGLTMLPLASYLISSLGWRASYHLLGAIICVVLIPLSLFIIRDRPQDKGLLPNGSAALKVESHPTTTTEWTLGLALRAHTYWLIIGALTLVYFGTAAVLAHAIPFFEDQGISPQMAATMLASAIGISIPARIVAGYIADKVSVRYVTGFSFLLQLAALVLLLEAGSMAVFWVFVAIFGVAMGGMFAMEPLLISEHFGMASFGAIYGTLWGLSAFGFAAGPPIAGHIFDTSGSYNSAFILFIATTILAVVLISFIKSPQPAEKPPPS